MKKINIIGLMSGTSLDGLDVASISFWFDEKWNFEILAAETYEYEAGKKNQLAHAIHLTGLELAKLNVSLGRFFGNTVNTFCAKHSIDKSKVAAIASHGHTVFHQPNEFLTLQIGCGAQISGVTGITTVCDFRTLDVGLGGQGAPLVPIGDALLFGDYTYCLNLGGIANVSFTTQDKRVAFDCCLANIVSNYLVQRYNLTFDDGGELAQKGAFNAALYEQMNTFEYFQQPYPKSLGIEFFNSHFKPLLDSYSCSIEDKLHTFGKHIAFQLATQLKSGSVLITGGGAYNRFWIAELKKNNPNLEITVPDAQLINFKEAVVFGFLGALRLEQQINTLASVTGASRDSIGGALYLGN